MKCGKCGARLPDIDYQYERLVLCEGAFDAELVRALFADRNIQDTHIRAAADYGHGGGRGCFGHALAGSKAATGFDKVKKIVVLTDCDEDRNASFVEVKQHLDPLPFLPPVTAPDQTAVGHNRELTVLMVPVGASAGSLDTIAYAAASENNARGVHVETFAANTGTTMWPPQKEAKMKLRSIVACTHEPQPDIPFSRIWSNSASHLIPVNSPHFDALAARLTTLLS